MFEVFRDSLKSFIDSVEKVDGEIIILKAVSDFSFNEIAEIMELNTNTVKSKFYRGIEMLRTILSQELNFEIEARAQNGAASLVDNLKIEKEAKNDK